MLGLEELKSQYERFRKILIFSYIFFAMLIFGAIYMLHIHYSSKQALQTFQEDAAQNSRLKLTALQSFYQQSGDVVSAIATNENFIQFLNGRRYYDRISSLFKTIMNSNETYMQLRFINHNGDEIIRFDRSDIGTTPNQTPIGNLQNKSKRYYFEAMKSLSPKEIWYSKIDLNVEHGEIEKPIKPVLRVAQPVYMYGQFHGFIILNIFMKPFLDPMVEAPGFDIYLVDNEGYMLLSPNANLHWTRYLNPKETTQKHLNIDVSELKGYKGRFIANKKMYIHPLHFETNNNLRLIYLESSKKRQETSKLIGNRAFYTVLFAILVAIPFAYLVSSPIANIYQSLQKKSKELSLLADDLEAQVKEEIRKNTIKDRLLENQSKLAALGEMIGNIAHQWRHPLTRLSLIVQNLKSFHVSGQLDSSLIDRYTNHALEQIDFMSETIEDFRTFYKDDADKTLFLPRLGVEKALKILGGSIKHQGISIDIDEHATCKVFGYPNQFAQVMLNILHNAKEALEEREIKKPFIKVVIRHIEERCLISVEDNGGGIDKENIEKIFDARFTTKQSTGTGIGLYMSKMIIEENFEGSIKVKNTPKGALFTISLPIG